MRKRELMKELRHAQERIRQLEDKLCPAHQHKWFSDYVEEVHICTVCGKVVPMDVPYEF